MLPLLIFPELTALLPIKPDVIIPEDKVNPAGIVPEAKCILPTCPDPILPETTEALPN